MSAEGMLGMTIPKNTVKSITNKSPTRRKAPKTKTATRKTQKSNKGKGVNKPVLQMW